MARPVKYNSFPQTGWPMPSEVFWGNAGGSIAAPGAGKHIHVLGVLADNKCEIRQTSTSGTILAHIPGDADGLRFPAALDMGENTAAHFVTSDDVTVFYYIHDTNIQ